MWRKKPKLLYQLNEKRWQKTSFISRHCGPYANADYLLRLMGKTPKHDEANGNDAIVEVDASDLILIKE